jgi:hypothetical protein
MLDGGISSPRCAVCHTFLVDHTQIHHKARSKSQKDSDLLGSPFDYLTVSTAHGALMCGSRAHTVDMRI